MMKIGMNFKIFIFVIFLFVGILMFYFYVIIPVHIVKEESCVPIAIPSEYTLDKPIDHILFECVLKKDSLILEIYITKKNDLNVLSPMCIHCIKIGDDGKKLFCFNKQYDVKMGHNRIILPFSMFPNKGEIYVGYFHLTNLYADSEKKFFGNRYSFDKQERNIFLLDASNPKTIFIDTQRVITRYEYIHHYVYAYDIDDSFKGFYDSFHNLLNGECVVELHNGSLYEGYFENGIFNGEGIFKDVLLNRQLKGNFIKGCIRRVDTIDYNKYKLIVDIPVFSSSYPVGRRYRQESIFVYGMNTERVFWTWEQKKNGEVFTYREVHRFDNNGNMIEREWLDLRGYYFDEGDFILGLKSLGESRSIGVAKIKLEYNAASDIIWEKYFDNKGKLIREGKKGIIGKTPTFKPLKELKI